MRFSCVHCKRYGRRAYTTMCILVFEHSKSNKVPLLLTPHIYDIAFPVRPRKWSKRENAIPASTASALRFLYTYYIRNCKVNFSLQSLSTASLHCSRICSTIGLTFNKSTENCSVHSTRMNTNIYFTIINILFVYGTDFCMPLVLLPCVRILFALV